MWEEGEITVNGVKLHYEAKVYNEPSEFGIDCGKISKLFIKRRSEILVLYDRRWLLNPKNDMEKKAVKQLLKKFK